MLEPRRAARLLALAAVRAGTLRWLGYNELQPRDDHGKFGSLLTPSRLDVSKPMLGIVGRNGDVQAKNTTDRFNDHDQLFGDKRFASQRFRVDGKNVTWDDEPNAADYFAVEDFFAGHGVAVSQSAYDSRMVGSRPVSLDPMRLKDLEFDESAHPRDEHGRFGHGGSVETLQLEGDNNLSVVNKLGTKGVKYESALRDQLASIPPEMRLAGGASTTVTIKDRPKDVPKAAQALFQVAGQSSPAGYLSVFPSRGDDVVEVAGNAVHEYGHAVDRWVAAKNGLASSGNRVANLSDSQGFRDAAARDASELKGVDPLRYGHVVSDPRETFAETFAALAGAKGRPEENAVYLGKFSRSAAWMRATLRLQS